MTPFSMGCLLVRIAANSRKLEPFRPLFDNFISLCGPHTGVYYMDSAVVGAGLWLYEKWKKALSLKQLALRGNEIIIQNLSSNTEIDMKYVNESFLINS
jgi:hypothetical protein